MKREINHLIQLQELALIREQEAFIGGDRLKELDKSISALTQQLPGSVRTIFQKLHKKDTVAVVPVSQAGCSNCGMKLPISLVQTVRAEERIIHCPNCTRILYYTEASAKTVAKKQLRGEPRKIGIERFSSEDLMIPRLEATTRDDAISELAEKMEAANYVEHADRLLEAALRREAIISTALGHGLAFPHVRSVEGGGLSLALGLSPKGIKFSATDKALTRVIFFVVVPTAVNAFYLRLLAGLTESFRDAAARKALLSHTAPQKLWKALKKMTKKSIS